MLLLTNFIAIIYIILLFRKKYPISLSMYWVVVFYAIYIFIPSFKNYITFTQEISNQTVEKIALYSLIGLLSFMLTNHFFLLRWKSIEKINVESMLKIPYKATKNSLSFLVIISTLLLVITIGIDGIGVMFSSGSSNVWLGHQSYNILVTLAELSMFYLAILGSVLVLTARTTREKKKSFLIFFLIIIIASILAYSRRYVIYPIFAILFSWLSKTRKKTKILRVTIVIFPFFFITLFLLGYYRTFGVMNFNMQWVINYFRESNFLNIFIANTDFAASYIFLSKQLDYGAISASPLGYFKLLFAPIPRSIWLSKPQYTSVVILSIIEPLKVSQGFSVATGYTEKL